MHAGKFVPASFVALYLQVHWKHQGKGGSFADFTCDIDFAMVVPDDLIAYRQSQARTHANPFSRKPRIKNTA